MLVQVPSEKAVEADASWGLRKKPGIPEEFQGGKFFMYDGPEFDFFDAIELYKKTHRGRNIWENEKKDTVQDTGEIWLYRYLAEHPARTLDPEEADLFYVPALLATSFRMWSQGFAYRRRIENMTQALMELPYLRRHQGADHLYVCSWWRCGAALRPLNALVEASATSLLVTMERFERWSHWKCPERLVVVPYVADINVTRHYSLTPFSERSISFLFVGCSRYRPERASMKGLRDINASYIRVPSNCEKFSVRPEDYAGLIMDSKFCLVPRGDTYTTRRLFDAVAAGCIPLIQDGGIRRSLPFVWKLDYSQFALFAPTRVFRKSADLLAHCSELLERPEAEFDQMQRVLFRVRDELVWGRGDPFGAAENLGSVGDNVLYEAMWKSSRLKRRGNVTTAPCLANWPQPNQ